MPPPRRFSHREPASASGGSTLRNRVRGAVARSARRKCAPRDRIRPEPSTPSPPPASGSSNPGCSRRCRISAGRARHPSASRPRERSTAPPCAPRTGCSATPRAPRASRSRWAGLRATADADLWFAVTGAWGRILLGGREVDPYEAHRWPAGEELHLDWFGHGARGYLAVRGGFDAPRALGSRATDLLAGLGPAPLRAGDVDPDPGDAAGPIPVAGVAPWGAPHDDELEIELAPGPRADWFTASARSALFETVWTVSNDADRIGVRLDGPQLERAREGELPSEGMVPGAIQVPPSGRRRSSSPTAR